MLAMQSAVEAADNCHRGVFFNVVNKTADTDVVITGFEAGAYSGDLRAALWVCLCGACEGNEAEEEAWRAVWTGYLLQDKTTQVLLREGVVIKAGATLGFLLHSPEDGVYYSQPGEGVEDGVLKVEPWYRTYNNVPFGPHNGGSYTPAGAICYAAM
jgi:hypothetical protein